MTKTKSLLILTLMLSFAITYCNNDNKDKAGTAKSKENVLQPAPVPKKEKPSKYVYYKKMDEKTQKPSEPVSKEEKKKLTQYYKVAYNKKNKILFIQKYKRIKKNKVKLISALYYEYNNRDHLIKKKFQQNKNMVVHHFNILGQVTEREDYIKVGKKKYMKIRKDYFNTKGLPVRKDYYYEAKLDRYITLEYYNDSDKVQTEKTYRKDVLLTKTQETGESYDNTFYLSIVRNYLKNGKLEKEIFYDAEEGKINHSKNYHYLSDGKAVVEEYDQDDKLNKKWYYDEKGKLSKIEDYDKNGKLIKTDNS